jgi:hypothetical protein
MDILAKDTRLHREPTEFTPLPGSGAMLCLNNKWITSRYADEIHAAVNETDHKRFFLKKYKKMNKTLVHYNMIHWDGIGAARKRLNETENITIAKYMNGWLNSGRQKGLFGKEKSCPCCGWHEETQMHMLQCTSPAMQQNRKSAFKSLEKYYHQHKIPALVYIPFIRICHAACEIWEPNLGPLPPEIHKAVTAQQELGGEFTLRGYLTADWITALQSQGINKVESKLNHMYLGLWRLLFRPVWDKRNELSHGCNSIVTRLERDQYITELKQWRRESASRLGVNQQYLIDYTDHEISEWTNSAMEATIRLLIRAARNFRTVQLKEGQHLITDFFQPMIYTNETQLQG